MMVNRKLCILLLCPALILTLLLVLPHCAALASSAAGSDSSSDLNRYALERIEENEASAVFSGSLSALFTVVSTIVSGIGEIITLWGISEWGLSFQSADGGAQAHALKKVVGGLVITLAPQIMLWLVTADTAGTA